MKITKENQLYKNIVNPKNLYMAIYSVDSYIFERDLLNKGDYLKLCKLKDKLNYEEINEVMNKVIEKINDVILKDKLFEISVFLRPKKYISEAKVESRPLHTSDLYTQIAIVAMLNPIIYDFDELESEKNGKLVLSDLSKLIPSNFYGNIPSLKAKSLFKPWQKMYKRYSKDITNSYSNYLETGEYNYEVTLDLKNFFPSINPYIIYRYVLEKLSIRFSDEEFDCLKVVLYKLLYFKVINLENCSNAREEYYSLSTEYKSIKDNGDYYSVGIVQGLPQAYFWGNICMIEVAKEFEKEFNGRSFYYVDDSVIYIDSSKDLREEQEKFKDKLKSLNRKLQQLNDRLSRNGNSEECFKLPDCKFREEIKNFSKNIDYKIEVHTNNKSKLSEIKEDDNGEQYLRYLSRQASLGARQLWSTFEDIEDISLKSKFETLEESVEKETDRIERIDKKDNSNHKKLLVRFKKFFKFRRKLMSYREDNQISSKDINNLLEKMNKKEIEKFFKHYDEDIFSSEYLFYLRNLKNIKEDKKEDKKEKCLVEIYYKKIKNKTNNFDQSIYNEAYKEIAYFSKVCSRFNIKESEYFRVNKYNSIEKRVNIVFPRVNGVHKERKLDYVKNIIKFFMEDGVDCNFYNYNKYLSNEEQLEGNQNLKNDEKLKECYKWVVNNDSELYRMVLNSIFSKVFNVVLNDKLQIGKLDNKPLTYSEFKILVYLRNRNFKTDKFLNDITGIDINDLDTIDYTLFEVIDYYNSFVSKPKLIDNLIEVHRYTSEMWKNGSKFLHFYTLHNQEHGADLIKNSVRFINSIDYFTIKQIDYYILFIACYLHDIAMVSHPDLKSVFNNNSNSDSNLIYTEFKREVEYDNKKEVKDLLVRYYQKLDEFFEMHVRNNHSQNSAKHIRTSNDLKFVQSSIRELVAEVSEAHGYGVTDIYSIKSEAKDSLVSRKYIKVALRVADLLDMSKNRITLAILENNLAYMSDATKFHWISHELIDQYQIETKYENRHIYYLIISLFLIKFNLKLNCNSNLLFLNIKFIYFLINKVSYLKPGTIKEKIILTIFINAKQLTQTKSQKCKYVCLNELKPSEEEIIQIKISKDKCEGDKCNFLCKWLAKKNDYLYQELFALNNYLRRNSNNYFTTEFLVKFKYTGEDLLNPEYCNILNNYIEG
ncbi:HD domain-containing protein [Halonatronum saccharophilum]|uniref:HD domain-containing protein n=1 Tax=Halonatronum saccharophilum TaxID=150060 RepID=UPI0004868AC8|nr:reverse transcriptase domain-containing protein [Halonatronum saccharophilum]